MAKCIECGKQITKQESKEYNGKCWDCAFFSGTVDRTDGETDRWNSAFSSGTVDRTDGETDIWNKINVGVWLLGWLVILPILAYVWCASLPFDWIWDELLGFYIASFLILIPLCIGHAIVSGIVLLGTKSWICLVGQIILLAISLCVYTYFMAPVFYG